MSFSIFSIFPRSSGTYFYDIFDQKFFRPKSPEIIDFKVGRSDPKVGGSIGPKQPHTEKSSKILQKIMFLRFFCSHAATSGCWKSYLLCSKRSENIINRKIIKFYIETIPEKNSQLRKKTFFRARRKNFRKFVGLENIYFFGVEKIIWV